MATATSRYMAALANQYRAAAGRNARRGVDYSALIGNAPTAAPVMQEAEKENPKGIKKVLDILSQPLYSTVETAKDTVADVYRGFHGGNAGDVAKGVLGIAPRLLGNLGSDNDKKTWSDVLRGDVDFLNDFNKQAGINHVVTEENGPLASNVGDRKEDQFAKFVLGLGADIAGDPTSYVGPGVIKAAVGAPIKLAGKTAIGASAINAAKASKVGQDFSTAATKFKGLAAGSAKADKELEAIDAAKIEAAAPAPVGRFEQPVPETPPVGERPFAFAENTQARNPEFELPKSEAPAFSPTAIPEEIEDSGKVARMLLTPEGDSVPRTANLARQQVSEPTYAESITQRLLDKPLIKDVKPTELQKAKADAQEILARQAEPEPGFPDEAGPVIPEARPGDVDYSPLVDEVPAITFKDIRSGFNDYMRNQIRSGSAEAQAYLELLPEMKKGTITSARRTIFQHLRTMFESDYVRQANMRREAERSAVRPSEPLEPATPPVVVRKPARTSATQADATAAVETVKASRARTVSSRRLGGAALQSWLKNSEASGLSAEHIAELTSAKTAAEYRKAVGRLKRLRTQTGPRNLEYTMRVYRGGKGVEVPENTAISVAEIEKALATPAAQALSTAESTEEILARINPERDPAAIAHIAAGGNLRPEMKDMLDDILEKQGWKGPTEELPFVSPKETRRSSTVLGEGIGRNVSYNAPMQQNIFARLFELNADAIESIRNAERMKSRGAAGTKSVSTKWKIRANQQVFDLIQADMKAVDDFFFANGATGIASAGQKGVPLYLSQMFDALNATEAGRNLLFGRIIDKFGFHIKRVITSKNQTGFRTAKTSMEGTADVDSLMKMFGRAAQLAGEPTVAGIRRFEEEFPKYAREFTDLLNGKHVGPQGETVRGIGKGEKGKGTSRVPVSEEQAKLVHEEVERAINDPEVLSTLFQHIRENAAKVTADFSQEVQSVSQNVVRQVLENVDNMTGLVNDADRVESLLHPERIAQQLTKDPDVAEIAGEAARAKIGEVVGEIDIKNASASQAAWAHRADTANFTSQNAANKANVAKYNSNVESSLREMDPEEVLNIDTQTDVAMQTGVFKMLDNFARRFVAHYGNATVHEAMTSMGSVGGVLSRTYARDLTKVNDIAKAISHARGLEIGGHKVVAKEAYDVIRAGEYDAVVPEMKELVDGMRNLVDYMFATERTEGKPQSVLSTFFREGFDLDHINMKMEQPRFGLPEEARLSKQTLIGKGKSRAATKEEISEQWKAWDIKDPVDFLHRMERVTTELATEISISREFQRLASIRGLAGTKPRPGFIAVNRQSLGSESILRYLPQTERGTYYVHRDLVPEIKRMDQLLAKTNSNNPEFQNFLRNNLDPILAMWKSGMTIWRPGHHFRNVVGDVGMAYLVSGVKNPIYYAKALKMIGTKQNAIGRTLRGDYGGWDALGAMQGIHRAAEGGAFNKELTEQILKLGPADAHANVVARGSIGKNSFDVTAKDLFRNLMDRGVLPDFRKQEDIIDVGNDSMAINKRIARRLNFEDSAAQHAIGRAHNRLATFTEGRDDFIRLAHAMHLIENGIDGKKAWSSVEEMYDKVAARIRKTHPDGTDLTPFEKNGMRRVFPFYSWTRKAIPLVFENSLTHPGRFLTYPKAMYNFGEANGVDLESLSDPFPEDQVFPKFISDKMTGIGWRSPDGHYWSFDMGIPQADIGNDFIGNGSFRDLRGGILGMLNPAIKAPIELSTGHALDTQIPISDTSDYVDSQIPGLNTINSIFGLSPSSVAENAGQGTLGIDQSRQAERGNRGGITENPEYALNYLLGQRLLDTSKPNYINLGRIQQLDDMKARAKNAAD